MLILEKVRFKNFFSVGKHFIEIELNKHNRTLLHGANGTSKSAAVTDSICFVLFGKPYRNINKPTIVNSINQKDCVVEIEFKNNGKFYKVIRGIKPNIFEIYCDGNLIQQQATLPQQQEYLEKYILKMNYKAFCQIVVLGSAAYKPFMQLTPAERREVIEDLLDIQVYSTMGVIAKQKLQTANHSISDIDYKIGLLNNSKEIFEKTIKSAKTSDENRLQTLREGLSSLDDEEKRFKVEISVLETENQSLLENTKYLTDVQSKLQKKLSQEGILNNNRERVCEEIHFLEDNDTCPTCNQEIEFSFKDSQINSMKNRVSEIDTGLETVKSYIDKFNSQITAINQQTEKLINNNRSIAVLNTKLEKLTEKRVFIINTIEDINNSKLILDETEKNLEKVIKERKDLEKQKAEIMRKSQYYEAAVSLLKDNGIKAKIVNQYMPLINKTINDYLKKMKYPISFHIDGNFKETIKSRYRNEYSYNNFSEGQKKRIDIAILYSWRYIAKKKNSVNCNLLVLDEIFDGSLDAEGHDDFLKILYETKDLNIFVISHKENLFDKFENVLKLELYKDFTRLSSKV